MDDLIGFELPEERPVIPASLEVELARVRASLPPALPRIGPKNSFELATQRDEFRREQESEHLREISCAVDPCFRATDDRSRERMEMLLNRSDEPED